MRQQQVPAGWSTTNGDRTRTRWDGGVRFGEGVVPAARTPQLHRDGGGRCLSGGNDTMKPRNDVDEIAGQPAGYPEYRGLAQGDDKSGDGHDLQSFPPLKLRARKSLREWWAAGTTNQHCWASALFRGARFIRCCCCWMTVERLATHPYRRIASSMTSSACRTFSPRRVLLWARRRTASASAALNSP